MIFLAHISCKSELPSLNGDWMFSVDSSSQMNENLITQNTVWKSMSIPGSWHSQKTGLLDYQGVVWFKKEIKLKKLNESKRMFVKFHAVDYLTKLYINKKYVGLHEGGYTPFLFDISDYIIEGDNEILLRVVDPVADESGTDGISYWHIPHGKQNWYVQNSGIWQEVELILKEKNYVENVLITPKLSGKFTAKIISNNSELEKLPAHIAFSIKNSRGNIVFSNDSIKSGGKNIILNGLVEKPELWEPTSPNLYRFTVTYGEDTFTGSFGFREFEVDKWEFFLNGKPFYMIGALDQDFYPETNYTTPSKEYLIDEMKKAKGMGLNTLRCHIKIPDKRYLDAADEVGLLIWSELPNWDIFDESVKSRYRNTFHEVFERDWNHPSFVVWGIINESWGIDLDQEEQRKWLLEEYDYAKDYAKGRVIVDNSACWGNYHVKTEINDYHTYWSIPENRYKFDKTIADVAGRADWLFSKYGDSEESGDEVLMISEFGNWGLPFLPKDKPMWFNRMFLDDWITLPEGVEKRFTDFKYNRIFDSYEDLAVASQMNQFKSLKYEIERIRLENEIKGYVITEFTDINWECNGLLDMWRNPKAFYSEMPMIQSPDIIIPVVDKYNFWSDEKINLNVFFSHYSNNQFSDLILEWFVEGKKIGAKNIKVNSSNYAVTLLHEFLYKSQNVNSPQKIKIDFKLSASNGVQVANNYIEVFVYPRIKISTDNVYITNSIDSKAINILKEGGNIICIIDSSSIMPAEFPFQVTSRDEDWYDGNWASNLNWISDAPPLKNIGLSKTLGFEIDKVVPNYVITDIPSENFDDVLSGMFVAWLYLNSAYIVQIKAGEGKIILTTFDMYNNYKSEPFASTLISELIKYVNLDKCNPKLFWKLGY